MQTIRITITSEKSANVVLTEKRPEVDKAKRKRSLHKKFEDLLSLMPKQKVDSVVSEGDKQSCD